MIPARLVVKLRSECEGLNEPQYRVKWRKEPGSLRTTRGCFSYPNWLRVRGRAITRRCHSGALAALNALLQRAAITGLLYDLNLSGKKII